MTRAGRRVGVDATCWMLKRGFGRHARSLLTALVEVEPRYRYTFFVDSPEAVPLLPAGVEVRLVHAAAPTIEAASAEGHRSFRDLLAMSRALSSSDLDTVLFPTLYSYVPTFGRAVRIVFVHDATAEMYPQLVLGGWKSRLLWRAKTGIGRHQADVLVTVSDYARDAIVRHAGVPADRLHVVGEASDSIFRVLDEPYPTDRLRALGFDGSRRAIVYVGGFNAHKNLDMVVRIVDRLARIPEFNDVDLFLVGEHERDSFQSCYQELAALVSARGLTSRVIFTGYLPDDDLVVLLNLATLLVLPSMTEGLGLPALEAAACGCPVIATTESPIADLLGEGGRYVDPRDEAQFERTIVRVLRSPDLRQRMREAGLAAARRLTWETAARRLAQLIESGVRS